MLKENSAKNDKTLGRERTDNFEAREICMCFASYRIETYLS